MLVPSLHRESTDSLIAKCKNIFSYMLKNGFRNGSALNQCKQGSI